jgi:hypothetical protein
MNRTNALATLKAISPNPFDLVRHPKHRWNPPAEGPDKRRFLYVHEKMITNHEMSIPARKFNIINSTANEALTIHLFH